MIEKDCDDAKGLWWLIKIVIKKNHAFIKMNFSGNVNELMRSVLNSFLFLTKSFCTHQKHQEHQQHKDAIKQKHKTLQANKNFKMRLKNI